MINKCNFTKLKSCVRQRAPSIGQNGLLNAKRFLLTPHPIDDKYPKHIKNLRN